MNLSLSYLLLTAAAMPLFGTPGLLSLAVGAIAGALRVSWTHRRLDALVPAGALAFVTLLLVDSTWRDFVYMVLPEASWLLRNIEISLVAAAVVTILVSLRVLASDSKRLAMLPGSAAV